MKKPNSYHFLSMKISRENQVLGGIAFILILYGLFSSLQKHMQLAAERRETADVLHAMSSTNRDIREKALEKLVKRYGSREQALIHLLQSEDEQVCEHAILHLVEMGRPAVKPLMILLRSDCLADNNAAFRALILLGDAAVPELLDAAAPRTHKRSDMAMEILLEIGSPAVTSGLVNRLAQDYEREAVIDALARIGMPAVDPLLDLAKKGNHNRMLRAVEALARLGSPLLPRMERMLKSGNEDDVNFALRVLLKMDETALPVLVPALAYLKGHSLQSVVNQVDRLDVEEALEPLVQILPDACNQYRNQPLSGAIANALEGYGARAVDPLIAALPRCDLKGAAFVGPLIGSLTNNVPSGLVAAAASDQAAVQYGVVKAVEKIGRPEGVAVLKPLMRASDSVVRNAAQNAVRKLAAVGGTATAELIAGLSSADAELRAACAEQLGRTGQVQAVEPLLATLRDTNTKVRYNGARALGRLGDPRAEQALIRCLHDTDVGVRTVAIMALGKVGGTAAANALGPMLATSHDTAAASSLVQIGSRGGSVKAVVEMLGDPKAHSDAFRMLTHMMPAAVTELVDGYRSSLDPHTRKQILKLLAKAPGDERVRNILLQAQHDQDAAVRATALDMLSRNGQTVDLQAYAMLLTHESRSVRLNAIRLLGNSRHPRAVAMLSNRLGAATTSEDCSIIEALRWLGDPAVPELTRIYQKRLAVLSREAARALMCIGTAKAVTPLQAAMHQRDLSLIALAYEYYILQGEESSLDPLSDALTKHGGSTMAEYFFSAGHPRLREAASQWARDHRALVMHMNMPGVKGSSPWGRNRR